MFIQLTCTCVALVIIFTLINLNKLKIVNWQLQYMIQRPDFLFFFILFLATN